MSNRENAYTEVYTILQELNEEEYSKIPPEVLETIEANINKEYEFMLDDELELKEQQILPETKAILFNLFRDYLATTEQKEKIIKMQNEERQKRELKKQHNYNVDVFQNKTKISTKPIENQDNELIEYRESIFTKIVNKIKNWFGKK